MKITGKITMSQYGVFVIDAPLLDTAKTLKETLDVGMPTSLTIELEALKPYTLSGIPIVFKMKLKGKKKGS